MSCGFQEHETIAIILNCLLQNNTIGGSKGGREGRAPRGPNSLNFMQFWGNFGKIV